MNVALILSGGTGTRLGTDIPKQYIEIDDRPVISYCIEQFIKHNKIDAVQIVADMQWHRVILKCLEKYDHLRKDCTRKFHGFSEPGENRQLSIYHGLKDIIRYASDSDIVIIHDAARPLISAQMITHSLNAVEGHDGVLPVLAMKDTVYKSEDGAKISALLDRSKIYAGQTPETFRIGRYYEANKKLFPDKIRAVNGSTEPAVMAGMDIVMISGDEKNFKITTKGDLERFCEMIKR
ncbi:MAG: 2-C-methyl-D-erythritol 4-phosphate cytidylyltransferase [Lachnospiraceae bacterium]|nr:2-C-methyl-D-erythritol 4-phosphate cytidylyltransferase [Lachnospiraceae bacterium]